MISGKLPQIWFGGDYNPDQWSPDTWQEDLRLFKLANINVVTLPIFSWTLLQPAEDSYDFAWLDDIIDRIYTNRIFICLATGTAAHPAWMAHRYPDVLRTDFHGRAHRFGVRHNSCPNSTHYRKFSGRLAERMAERYGRHPGLVAWHVSNEYGGYCYCDRCAAAFRKWLEARYGSLKQLNQRWGTRFWNHTFTHWDEIVPPDARSEYVERDGGSYMPTFQSIVIDYRRFQSQSLLDCFKVERDAIRPHSPGVAITTNLMGLYDGIDAHRWAREMDIVSWDSYPANDDDPSMVAMRHAAMRGANGGRPFMMMEQAPNQQNWKDYNATKPPGLMRLWSYQAVAHGADTVMFFQLRQSRTACEKWHSAVIDHSGREDTRTFKECTALGQELKDIGEQLLDSRHQSDVAMIFDWDAEWALNTSSGPSVDLRYVPQVHRYYKALWQQGVSVDIIHPDHSIANYKVIVAPVLYLLQPGFAERIEKFVKAGGIFVTTFCSGLVDDADTVFPYALAEPLRRVLGVWVEERDALPPASRNQVAFRLTADESSAQYDCGLICDVVVPESAEVIATYTQAYYAGRAAITRNSCGAGEGWYIGTDVSPACISKLLKHICDHAGIIPLIEEVPAGVEVTQRIKDGRCFTFILNHAAAAVCVTMGASDSKSLLGPKIQDNQLTLAPREVAVLSTQLPSVNEADGENDSNLKYTTPRKSLKQEGVTV